MRWVPAGVIAALALALPASAQDSAPPRIKAKPKVGTPKTTFTVRYVSRGSDAHSSDYVYLNGPAGTRCDGEVLSESVGTFEGKQRIDMGPRVPDDDPSLRHYAIQPYYPGDGAPRLKRWCRGVYRGGIYFEREDEPEVEDIARFRFRVK